MTREELINLVKTKVDEVSPPDAVVHFGGSCQVKPVNTMIDELLDECSREVLMKAPLERVPVTDLQLVADGNADGSGIMILPEDFIRLAEVKLQEWKRPVIVPVLPGSDIAKRQYNKYLRGGPCKPVCILTHRSGRLALEYFSVEFSHRIERFAYVRRVPAEDLPIDMQLVVAWFCAAKVLSIVGKTNEAKVAYELGVNLF